MSVCLRLLHRWSRPILSPLRVIYFSTSPVVAGAAAGPAPRQHGGQHRRLCGVRKAGFIGEAAWCYVPVGGRRGMRHAAADHAD